MKELRQEGKIGQIPDYSPIMKPEFPKSKAESGNKGVNPKELLPMAKVLWIS